MLHEFQYWPGYCLLLADPLVGRLNDLHDQSRVDFLTDMARVGDALLAVTGAARINYSIYGNLDPFLHAHVVPRYSDEDAQYRTTPPLAVPASVRDVSIDDSRVADLIQRIRTELTSG